MGTCLGMTGRGKYSGEDWTWEIIWKCAHGNLPGDDWAWEIIWGRLDVRNNLGKIGCRNTPRDDCM